jgi:hypothetical protein
MTVKGERSYNFFKRLFELLEVTLPKSTNIDRAVIGFYVSPLSPNYLFFAYIWIKRLLIIEFLFINSFYSIATVFFLASIVELLFCCCEGQILDFTVSPSYILKRDVGVGASYAAVTWWYFTQIAKSLASWGCFR